MLSKPISVSEILSQPFYTFLLVSSSSFLFLCYLLQILFISFFLDGCPELRMSSYVNVICICSSFLSEPCLLIFLYTHFSMRVEVSSALTMYAPFHLSRSRSYYLQDDKRTDEETYSVLQAGQAINSHWLILLHRSVWNSEKSLDSRHLHLVQKGLNKWHLWVCCKSCCLLWDVK